MHYIAEIVIPPNHDVVKSVKQIMEYFCDDKYDKEGNEVGKKENADWWDFYVIGGRFSGHKLECSLGEAKLNAFRALLNEKKVTVSSVRCGKEELQPASQIPMVDALWREHFPGTTEQCPLFNHSRDQYREKGYYSDDICLVKDIPEELTCERLIVAGPHWDKKRPNDLEPKRMLATEYWNHVEHQKTSFDGKVKPALALMQQEEEQWKKVDADDNWLVVTVDYHN